MGILKISELREYAELRKQTLRTPQGHTKTASRILLEAVEKDSLLKTYDVFLSHAFKDADLVLGAKTKLEERSLSVYVDWIEDPQLDRSKVTVKTADTIKERMIRCSSLFYFTTSNSIHSKWMPWEAGYFDGKKNNKVAILPAIEDDKNSFNGQEYLDLYPFIDFTDSQIWVNKKSKYITFKEWLSGEKKL